MTNKDGILYRIFNRTIILKLGDSEYIVKSPSVLLRYHAELYKEYILDEYKYELPTLEKYDDFLMFSGLIDKDYKSKIKNMGDAIRRLKLELYQSGPRIEQEKKTRHNLKIMKDKLNTYLIDLDFKRRPTIEYFAENLKNKYILINSVFDKQDNLAFDKSAIDMSLLSKVIDVLNENDIAVEDFRELARTEPWREYWNNKGDIFGIPVIDYSEDQRLLCSYSRMYDSIFAHPEVPDINVINDNDKLDGFLIYLEEKNKKENKKEFTNMDSRFQEVYISASNKAEAAEIYNANSEESKRILKQRAAVLKNKNEVVDADFIDVKLDRLAQVSEQESSIIRKR